ncbi:RNA polymerase sigma factor [Pedobacter sp. V48]|uniref:RNA polymerase sigma factor n=1 Tax=Pedobacter sp. V48 TaxID=509635 RepID=UPI0003E4A724|nr:sigma-70 family RNA polymerase sigma factor [Pedobacter sp. V48]ETZ24632.1 hypothetical protein N824_14035 [Pedobacter sp. V48]
MSVSDTLENDGLKEDRPTDQELWGQFRYGDHYALFELYKRLQLPLINYCFKLYGDRQQAQDSFSGLMIRLWDRRGELKNVANVKSYLMTTLRRQFITDLKVASRFEVLTEEDASSEPSHEDDIIDVQEQESQKRYLKYAFTKLTPRQREFITFRFFNGMSYDEIAESTGIKKRAVYNKVHEGIKILRKNLPDQFHDGPGLIFFLLLCYRTHINC